MAGGLPFFRLDVLPGCCEPPAAATPMSQLHPCRLSYSIEHEIDVDLYISGPAGSVRFALDRFEADENRFRVG